MRVPEYFSFDPFGEELAGFALREGGDEPLELDNQGRLFSQQLGLCLVRWEGTYQEIATRWLRWATPEGALLLTAQEVAEQERQ